MFLTQLIKHLESDPSSSDFTWTRMKGVYSYSPPWDSRKLWTVYETVSCLQQFRERCALCTCYYVHIRYDTNPKHLQMQAIVSCTLVHRLELLLTGEGEHEYNLFLIVYHFGLWKINIHCPWTASVFMSWWWCVPQSSNTLHELEVVVFHIILHVIPVVNCQVKRDKKLKILICLIPGSKELRSILDLYLNIMQKNEQVLAINNLRDSATQSKQIIADSAQNTARSLSEHNDFS